MKSFGSVLAGTLTQPSSLLPNYFIRSSQSTARFPTTKMGTPGPPAACTSFSLTRTRSSTTTPSESWLVFETSPRTSSWQISSVVCVTLSLLCLPYNNHRWLPFSLLLGLSSSGCERMDWRKLTTKGSVILPLDVTRQVNSACGCVAPAIGVLSSWRRRLSLQLLLQWNPVRAWVWWLSAPTSPAPEYKAYQLEGVYGSLQSHGMPWTSWKECTVPSRVMECLEPAGRSVRFPPESWNALYQLGGVYGSLHSHGMPWTSWKECTVPSRVMECLGPAGRSVRFPPESWNALNQLEGVYGSLQSHGMPWTSWKECTVPSRVMECLEPAGRSVRFPPESWNALDQL